MIIPFPNLKKHNSCPFFHVTFNALKTFVMEKNCFLVETASKMKDMNFC